MPALANGFNACAKMQIQLSREKEAAAATPRLDHCSREPPVKPQANESAGLAFVKDVLGRGIKAEKRGPSPANLCRTAAELEACVAGVGSFSRHVEGVCLKWKGEGGMML